MPPSSRQVPPDILTKEQHILEGQHALPRAGTGNSTLPPLASAAHHYVMTAQSTVTRPASASPFCATVPVADPAAATKWSSDGDPICMNRALHQLQRRLTMLESTVQDHASMFEAFRLENRDLKNQIMAMELFRIKARTKPASMLQSADQPGWPKDANLVTVVTLEGFERQIASKVTPCTGNRRLAGKVCWNKLQKTCRALYSAPVSQELDPCIRIVPDNFPTIRRAVQNIDKGDALDRAHILVRPRKAEYAEHIVIDRRVRLIADPNANQAPVIHGRICITDSAAGSVLQGFTVRNNNPRDPWGSALDISGANNVLIEGCELSSSSNDEVVLRLHDGCAVTVRRNVISGCNTQGVTGISIESAAMASLLENNVNDCNVGIQLQPSATVNIKKNVIARNQRGIQLDGDDIEAILAQEGFGHIMLRNNQFVNNGDGQDDTTFLKSLELLWHPLLRRKSKTNSMDVFDALEMRANASIGHQT